MLPPCSSCGRWCSSRAGGIAAWETPSLLTATWPWCKAGKCDEKKTSCQVRDTCHVLMFKPFSYSWEHFIPKFLSGCTLSCKVKKLQNKSWRVFSSELGLNLQIHTCLLKFVQVLQLPLDKISFYILSVLECSLIDFFLKVVIWPH